MLHSIVFTSYCKSSAVSALKHFLHYTANFQALVRGPFQSSVHTTVKKSKATVKLKITVQIAALGSVACSESEHGTQFWRGRFLFGNEVTHFAGDPAMFNIYIYTLIMKEKNPINLA